MSYKYETHLNAPAYTKGRPAKPTDLVIHHYGDDSATYESSNAWLTRPGATTSAHYVVDAGRVACIVDPDDTAYHAGNWSVNQRSIGVENHPVWTAAREKTLIQLCADLEERYGSLNYSVHQNHSQTACPGRWVARVPHIIAGVNAELARRKKPTVKVARAVKGYVHRRGVKAFHRVRPGDTVNALVDYYGSKASLIVKWNKLRDADHIEVGQNLRVR